MDWQTHFKITRFVPVIEINLCLLSCAPFCCLWVTVSSLLLVPWGDVCVCVCVCVCLCVCGRLGGVIVLLCNYDLFRVSSTLLCIFFYFNMARIH